jgi:hypothetical protein
MLEDVAGCTQVSEALVLPSSHISEVEQDLDPIIEEYSDSGDGVLNSGENPRGLPTLEEYDIDTLVPDLTSSCQDFVAAHEVTVIFSRVVPTHWAIVAVYSAHVGHFDNASQHDRLTEVLLPEPPRFSEELFLLAARGKKSISDFSSSEHDPASLAYRMVH